MTYRRFPPHPSTLLLPHTSEGTGWVLGRKAPLIASRLAHPLQEQQAGGSADVAPASSCLAGILLRRRLLHNLEQGLRVYAPVGGPEISVVAQQAIEQRRQHPTVEGTCKHRVCSQQTERGVQGIILTPKRRLRCKRAEMARS
jgi:hypothetical protein